MTALILLPLFVPPWCSASGSLAFHRAVGLWGHALSLAIAHSLWAVPLVFLVARASLAGVDRSLEEAAATQGAGRASACSGM